jgi:CRISPR-associated protein Cmr6
MSITLPEDIMALDYLTRSEKWVEKKNKYRLDKGNLSFTITGQDNLYLSFYRMAPDKLRSDAYAEQKYAYLKALAKRWNDEPTSGASKSACAAFSGRMGTLLSNMRRSRRVGVKLDMITDARLIAGLGYKGPLEVGITLHPLYGFPYLPGSTVKGIARAFAELVLLPQQKCTRERLAEVFGSPDKFRDQPDSNQTGRIQFFDALPATFPELAVEYMTPHYGDYYMKGATPGDWLNPNPVPFLAVAEGQKFQFVLTAMERDDVLLHEVAGWLKDGLAALGAGGKTAAGYGYFANADDRKAEAEELARLAEQYQREQKRSCVEPEEPEVTPPKEVPPGYSSGGVVVIKAKNMRGKIEPDEGGESVPFRVEDASGVGSGDAVIYKIEVKNGEPWAVEVRKR